MEVATSDDLFKGELFSISNVTRYLRSKKTFNEFISVPQKLPQITICVLHLHIHNIQFEQDNNVTDI